MDGVFVDTNIFLRHLLNDDPLRSPASRELIRSIERGDLIAWTSALVISEIVFVLSNRKTYGVARTDTRDWLMALIGLPGLKLELKRVYRRTFDLYTSLPIDYVDAYHAALLEYRGQDAVFSYDADFDLVPALKREEPA